ncbi:MAG: RHS repeat-associated core domain-containing protein [Bdellovibrionales bacterium]
MLWAEDSRNRFDDTANGASSSYKIADDSNRIVGEHYGNGTRSFGYNPTGSLTKTSDVIMGYDGTERMYIAASRHNHDFALYRYNGLGERTHKFGLSSGKVLYAYDADHRIIGEYKQALNSTKILSSTETIYMPNVADYGSRDGYMPIGVLKDGELYYVACGLQGEPRYIVDSTNKPVWRWRHDAFGRGAPDQRPSGSSKDFVYNNRFPGQTYDAETGFFYNLNRYYDPATGRYTRPDPIGLAGGMNPYAYVGGNPVTNVDPSGLVEIDFFNRTGGRNPFSLTTGPTYGNWCGGKWSGRQYTPLLHQTGTEKPVDSLDNLCQAHDDCYLYTSKISIEEVRSIGMKSCDQTLVKGLEGLSSDPREWPVPPVTGTEESARRYRVMAQFLFSNWGQK